VYENDHFEYVLGDDPKIIHKPTKLGQPKGVMIGCYAILRRGNDVWREVMDSSQVEAVRAMSRAKDSLMWTQFASEGYRKTVVRRCAKLVPIQDEMIERTLRDDDETFDMGAAPAQAAAEPSADPTVVAQQAKVETTKAAKPKANGKARPAALAKALEQEDEQVPESENPAPAEKPAYEDPPHEGGADEDDIF
jgi:recombination protein RecT